MTAMAVPAGPKARIAAALAPASPPWYAGVLVGFDLETTGTDPSSARVVTAAISYVAPSGALLPRSREWIVDPGVDIPDGARAVHGISTEQARRAGGPALTGLWEILDDLADVCAAGLPLVVFNAPYDLTLMDAEAARYGLPGLQRRPEFERALVVDPLVIDRFVDPGRDGPRTLQATAEAYGVAADAPHTATGDALTACLVARVIGERYPLVGTADPATLHAAQQEWYRRRAVHVQASRRAHGDADAVVDKGWPVSDGHPVWFVPRETLSA
jgi:DNA polymerase-3 subunit epsilon